jgi:membrane protein YqaA with SNARE-associated domain
VHRVVLWVQGVVIPALGPPGIFLAAFLDSSFLSLPEVNDFIVVTGSAARPADAWMLVVTCTLGSVAGSSVLWWLGRRGGQALLSRRVGAARAERTRSTFRRFGVLAIAVPAVLPPPTPFKIFVLAAGVFGFPYRRFALTLLAARGLRYSFWGTMGIVYGPRAEGWLKAVDAWVAERAAPVAIVAALAILVVIAVAVARRRPRPAAGAGEAP